MSAALRKKYKSFGFGPKVATDRSQALEQALCWLWKKHKVVCGEERPTGCEISSIDDYAWDGVLDSRDEIVTRTHAKKPKVKG